MNDMPSCKCNYCEHSIVKLNKISCKFGECVFCQDEILTMIKGIRRCWDDE
jgi:hypothetical protein